MWDNSQVNARCANNHVFLLSLVIILIFNMLFSHIQFFFPPFFLSIHTFVLYFFHSIYLLIFFLFLF